MKSLRHNKTVCNRVQSIL